MPIVDVRSQGGKMPEPGETETTRVTTKKDPVDAIMEAELQGERLAAFKRGAGHTSSTQVATPAKSEERTTLDVAAMFSAATKLMGDLITQIAGKTENNPLLTYILEDLRQTKENMASSDPMAGVNQAVQTFSMIKDMLKQDLGTTATGVQDVRALIELEKAKGDTQVKLLELKTGIEIQLEKFRQEGEERRRRWQVEDEQRQQDREDRKAEREYQNKKDESRAAMFEDLAQSLFGATEVTDANNGTGRQPTPAAGQPKGAAAQYRATKFKCKGCGQLIDIPPDKDTFICPNFECEMEYKMSPMP